MAPKAVMVGLPGSGKSTIGRRLAKALDVSLLDTDVAIEHQTGRTVAEIFASGGEPEFRRIEQEVVLGALASHEGVVSLGGGAITIAAVRDALVGLTVVYLEIGVHEGVRRTSGSTVRPLLVGVDRAQKFRSLISERAPLYRRVATIRVNTNRRHPNAVVRYVLARLENQPPVGSRRRRRGGWRRAGAPAPRIRPAVEPTAKPTPATQAALAVRSARREQAR